MAERIKMRVNCAQYGGEPVSVFAVFDPDTEVLAIVRSMKYEVGPRDGFLRITTRPADPVHDAVFTEDDVREAIAGFFDLNSMGLVQYGDLARLNPLNKIEPDGMTETGIRYRLHPDIKNEQVAVMIAAMFATRQRAVAAAADFTAQLLTI